MKKIMKSIAFDMDGVLFDFASGYAAEYNMLHPDDIITADDILQNWNVSSRTKYVEKLWKNPGFFIGLKPYEGMGELFRWCYKNYNTFVISTAPAHMLDEKVQAMQKLCPEFNEWDIFFCNRKDMVRVDVLVDDAPHNIMACDDHCVIFDHPYNSDCHGIARVKTAKDLRLWIQKNVEPKEGSSEAIW